MTARKELGSGSSQVVVIEGDATENFVETNSILTSGGHAIYVSAGGLNLKAHQIRSTVDTAISVVGGTGTVVIDAYEIQSDLKYAVHYNATYPILIIRDARIISLWDNSQGYAVYNESSASDKIKLHGCVLIAAGASAINIVALGNTANPKNFHFLVGVALNKVLGTNVHPIGLTPPSADALIS